MSSLVVYQPYVGSKKDKFDGIINYLKMYKVRYDEKSIYVKSIEDRLKLFKDQLEKELETNPTNYDKIISLKIKHDDLSNKYNNDLCELNNSSNTFMLDLCNIFIN